MRLAEQELMQHVDSLTQSLIVIVSFVFGSFLCGLVIPHNVFRFGGRRRTSPLSPPRGWRGGVHVGVF